jgi:hypothetical protein
MKRKLKPITPIMEKKINSFWNYVQKNEQEIYLALLLGIRYDAVFALFDKKLSSISKRIGYMIVCPINDPTHYQFVFTCGGYRKLFAKILALEDQAPKLEHFSAEAFIKPMGATAVYKNGTDSPLPFDEYEIKISDMQMALEDYDIASKRLKINIYIPYYHELKEWEYLKSEFVWVLMHILGEIAYRKHIRDFQLQPMPLEPFGLLPLIELPDYIAYLYAINSRRKTRVV